VDVPPGHRKMRLGREYDIGVEPGDILYERGPRIGERWWQVVDLKPCVKYDHVVCRQVEIGEVMDIRADDPDCGYYHLVKG
jgi:hypothetical protein